MKGAVPPVSAAVALPSLSPLQETLFKTFIEAVSTPASVMITKPVAVQEFASVTVMRWLVALSPVAIAFVSPLPQS